MLIEHKQGFLGKLQCISSPLFETNLLCFPLTSLLVDKKLAKRLLNKNTYQVALHAPVNKQQFSLACSHIK